MELDLDQDFRDFSLEDDHESIHLGREEARKRLFIEAKEEIKKKKKFVDNNDVDQFFKTYGDIVGKSLNKPAGNLLHTLVDVVTHNGIQPEGIQLLVRRLVEKFPDLLKHKNEEKYNPLFMAIKASHHQLVDYMVTTCVAMKEKALHEQCLDDSLKERMKDGTTCLHVAMIATELDTKTKRILIENASDEALAAQDDFGRTPMHYAAVFKRCNHDGVELIRLFIERDLKATRNTLRPPKTFLDLNDEDGHSVYWQHYNSRVSIIQSYEKWLEKRRQLLERNPQNVPRASNPVEKPVLGELNPQPTTGPSKSMASDRLTGDQKDRLNQGNARDDGYDENEKQPQMEKAAEAENFEASELFARTHCINERDVVSRDASQAQPIKLCEPDDSEAQMRATQAANCTGQPEAVSNMSLKRRGTTRADSELGQEEEKPAAKAQPKKRDSSEVMATFIRNSDDILHRLKLHYMRTRTTEMVISFLYGSNMQDIQVSFDYDSLPRKVPWTEFLKRFGADATSDRLRFDSTLQYVIFPKVQVFTKSRLADREREAEEQSGVRQFGLFGRKDMKYFLDWLYNKGVRHIITLSVEDSGDSGEKVHSDQIIQESLERFTIERLDWRKIDLDPETILHIGSKVDTTKASTNDNGRNIQPISQQLRRLSLKWSGSNSVLRDWNEPEGLPLLPRLQRIYIYKPPSDQEYESPQWIDTNVRKFQIRLNANRRALRVREATASADQNSLSDGDVVFGDVKVELIDSGKEVERTTRSRETPHFATSTITKGVNSHLWLDSTTRFAGEMTYFWQKTVQEFLSSKHNQGATEKLERDVIIALIDDGVDMFDPALSDRVLEGKSFDFHDGKVRPSFSSAEGHGTVMASMILRTCLMAKVYPIRLKTYPNANGKSNIDAEYAAQAILAALNKKADIISMSWTLPMSKNRDGSKNRLHEALKLAVDKKALMFCSAPDEGKFTKLDYPSGPWREDFFRIGAAGADDTVFQWTPEDGITYVLPGVEVIRDQVSSSSFDVLSATRFTKRVEDFKYETGSSVATALAAGLAAMIIYCIKASIMNMKIRNQNKDPIMGTAIGDNDASLIASPDAMKRAFARLGSVTPSKFIQVWEKFDGISDTLEMLKREGTSPEEKIKCIKRFVEFGSELANSIRTS